MDYERVEQLSKKLSNTRVEIRLRSASNLLFKLDSGIFDQGVLAKSSCIATLLEGVLRSLDLIVQNQSELLDPTNDAGRLLTTLMQLVIRTPVPDSVRPACVATSSKILEIIYQLKTLDGLASSVVKSLEQVRFLPLVDCLDIFNICVSPLRLGD